MLLQLLATLKVRVDLILLRLSAMSVVSTQPTLLPEPKPLRLLLAAAATTQPWFLILNQTRIRLVVLLAENSLAIPGRPWTDWRARRLEINDSVYGHKFVPNTEGTMDMVSHEFVCPFFAWNSANIYPKFGRRHTPSTN
jgi:hypothetical protein